MAAALCARLRVPREFTDLAVLAAAEHGNVHKCMEMRPATVVDLLMRLTPFAVRRVLNPCYEFARPIFIIGRREPIRRIRKAIFCVVH